MVSQANKEGESQVKNEIILSPQVITSKSCEINSAVKYFSTPFVERIGVESSGLYSRDGIYLYLMTSTH